MKNNSTKAGIVIAHSLYTPDTTYDKEGIYWIKMKLTPADFKTTSDLVDKDLLQLLKDNMGLYKGIYVNATYRFKDDMYIIKAKSYTKPIVMDTNCKQYQADPTGKEAQISFHNEPYQIPGTPITMGISLRLDSVRVIDEMEITL